MINLVGQAHILRQKIKFFSITPYKSCNRKTNLSFIYFESVLSLTTFLPQNAKTFLKKIKYGFVIINRATDEK